MDVAASVEALGNKLGFTLENGRLEGLGDDWHCIYDYCFETNCMAMLVSRNIDKTITSWYIILV